MNLGLTLNVLALGSTGKNQADVEHVFGGPGPKIDFRPVIVLYIQVLLWYRFVFFVVQGSKIWIWTWS